MFECCSCVRRVECACTARARLEFRTTSAAGWYRAAVCEGAATPPRPGTAMERVLKRVGLSRRSLAPSADEEPIAPPKNQRRRRRSKSRRRSIAAAGTSTTTNRPGAAGSGASESTATGTSTTITLAAKKPAKTRGLFSFDWDAVRDCRSCKSRALLSKRFCSRKCDNELYRSNSFKFERFVRGDGDTDGVSTLGKKVSQPIY